MAGQPTMVYFYNSDTHENNVERCRALKTICGYKTGSWNSMIGDQQFLPNVCQLQWQYCSENLVLN